MFCAENMLALLKYANIHKLAWVLLSRKHHVRQILRLPENDEIKKPDGSGTSFAVYNYKCKIIVFRQKFLFIPYNICYFFVSL